MRILGVRFKNLNSLTGEWHVDFTHPAFASDGIFAITGPTGAGKTTILDAICLGLYGRTPRLDKVTKNSNEAMSRQTGECFAEVTFETQKGRFRCHWSQHRARKRPEGDLQQARHEIADADSGAVLESKITQVDGLIEKLTGMDFGRFTRSMLLAQGGFTAFLQASPDARAPILEQITGTEIYSQISVKVHERRGQERDKLDLLQAELKGIHLLGKEEEEELQVGMRDKQSREKEIDLEVQGLRKSTLWIETVASLEKEVILLDRMWGDLEAERQAFAPEAEKLEKRRRAESLQADYREVEVLRGQQESENKDLDRTIVVLSEKEKDSAKASGGKLAAETALKNAREQQRAKADTIRRVRDLDIQVMGLKKQIGEKDKAIKGTEEQEKGLRDNLAGFEEALKNAQAELETVDRYQVQHLVDAALVTNLSAITKGFMILGGIEDKHVKARERAAAAAKGREDAAIALKTIEDDQQKLRKDLDEKQKEVKCLTDEINAILAGHDTNEWRDDLDNLKDRGRLLVVVSETIKRIADTSAALQALDGRLVKLKADDTKLEREIKAASDRKALLETELGNLEVQVSLLGRIQNLEDERKRLEDGSPCPLCGALDHPYARGNTPQLSDAEGALKKAKVQHKSVSEMLSKLEKDRAAIVAAVGHAGKEIDEKELLLEKDEKQVVESLIQLGIEPIPEERAIRIHDEEADVQSKISEMSQALTLVQKKSAEEKDTQSLVDSTRAKLDSLGKAVGDARRKADAATLEHTQLIKNSETLAEEKRKAIEAVIKDVEPFEVGQVSLDNIQTIEKMLIGRKDTWQKKTEQKTACEKKIDGLKAEISKTVALLASLEADLKSRRKDREMAKGEHASLTAIRHELFGEKDADIEEKQLADKVKKAEEAAETARKVFGDTEKEIVGLKERIFSLKEKTANRAKELMRVENNLEERIKKVGFEDEPDFRSSCLPEEERERLAEKQTSLVSRRAELEVRRKDRSEALKTECEKQLTDLPMETVREQLANGESILKQLQESIGATKNRLSQNEELKKIQREQIRSIDAQKQECFRWDELHQLIGSADGKKFRNFAQGLTFEIMVGHANRQLLKMTDRYVLTRDDAEPLELCVVDNYQAGEIRSTKNLSGGEAFIVSLALALGLSQMSSRNVRVDSLFLDEGFGTLDEDALETALETLAGLQQESKLIGVISHVGALKERISTQIQVIPQTGGRSIIVGPGCSPYIETRCGVMSD
jgi:exonuclease SbcC